MRHTTVVLTSLWLVCSSQRIAGADPAAAQGQSAPRPTQRPARDLNGIVQHVRPGHARGPRQDRDAYRRDPTRSGSWSTSTAAAFDTEGSARLGARCALAHGDSRAAQAASSDAFYHSLLTIYGSALVDFTADRLKIFPTKVDPTRHGPRCAPSQARQRRSRRVNYYLHKTGKAGRRGTW